MIGKYSNKDFLKIYINILEELRENGKIFSQQNPELAPYLDLSHRKSNDPETERLIESFAYMFAQVEHKSYLAQNDYVLNFIEHIFPELILPIPSLTVLKIVPNIDIFSDKKNSFIIPKSTRFLTKNKNNLDCQFLSTQESFISSLNIEKSYYIDTTIHKENILNYKKAIVINLETLTPISYNKKDSEDLSIYIDSDFYLSISIYDALFSSTKPIALIVDGDESNPIYISKENLKHVYNFESEDRKNNILYPIFDFMNYYQKYLFLNLNLNSNIKINNKLKIIIPVIESADGLSRIGDNFLHLNCITVKNYFEKKLEPIKCSSEKFEYTLKIDGSLSGEVELLSVKNVKTYNSLSGEAFNLPAFHKENRGFYVKKENFYKNFHWTTRRSFYDETKENGAIHLRLLPNEKVESNETIWPEYLFASAYCTNGVNAEYIKPFTDFHCSSSDLPIVKSFSLFWPKYSGRPLKKLGNNEVLKFLYIVNQDIIANKLFNENEFETVLDYLTQKGNSVKNLLNQILSISNGFKVEETINHRIWKNQSYNLPGIEYKLLFNKKDGYPRGTFFLINFLNGYFDYIKEFNFVISFEAELI